MAAVTAVTNQGGTDDQHGAHGNPCCRAGTEASGCEQRGRGRDAQRWRCRGVSGDGAEVFSGGGAEVLSGGGEQPPGNTV